jgi:hypothetical protein
VRRLSAPDTAAIAAYATTTAAALATPDDADDAPAATSAAAAAAAAAATPCVDWVVTRVAPLAHLLPGCLLSRAPPLRLSQEADAGADAAADAATTAAFLRGWAHLSREGSPVAMAARPADGSAAEMVLWHTDAGEPAFLFVLIGGTNCAY